MSIKPLHDRVLILPFQPEEQTAGGIFIPDNLQKRKPEGTVFAKGDKVTTLNIGDKVLYGKNTGHEVEDDNYKFLLMREGDVFGVI